MKNIKLNLWVMIAACWLPLSILAQPGITSDREVTFLHGLNGSAADWQPFSDFFSGQDNRRINPTNFGYNSTGGFNSIATDIRARSSFGANSIAICHSMGGVMARRLDKNNTAMGGIVTVGSPLDGAPIANAVADGRAADAANDGISTMVRGPLASLGFVTPLITFYGNAIGATFLPLLIQSKVNPNRFGGSATVNDIKVGGSGIGQDINASPTNTPKISIWGNENSPIHWQLMASQSGDDVPHIANNLSTIYEVAFFTHIGIAAYTWWNPWGWWSAYAAYEWYGGWQWIDNDSERIWNNLIGSDLVATQCYQYPTIIYEYDENCVDVPRLWRNCTRTAIPVTLTRCVQVHSNGISDAFIPATSQRGNGSNSWRVGGSLVIDREAFGVNHSEELDANNAVMRSIFNEIFANTTSSDPVFRIDRR